MLLLGERYQCDVSYLIEGSPSAESLAEKGGDPDLAVESGRDAGPAVVGGGPVGARGVPLVALHEMRVDCVDRIHYLRG